MRSIEHFNDSTLPFEVVEQKMQTVNGGALVDNYKLLVNDQTGTQLAVVGKDYRTFTNEEFTQLIGHVSETMDLHLEHITVVNDGKKNACCIWSQ